MIRTSSRFRSGTRRNKHYATNGGEDAVKSRTGDFQEILNNLFLKTFKRSSAWQSKPGHATRTFGSPRPQWIEDLYKPRRQRNAA